MIDNRSQAANVPLSRRSKAWAEGCSAFVAVLVLLPFMQQDFVQQDCLHHGHRYQVFIVRLMLGISLEISTWIGNALVDLKSHCVC